MERFPSGILHASATASANSDSLFCWYSPESILDPQSQLNYNSGKLGVNIKFSIVQLTAL